ncbi:MAG: response regulator transcription factor [Bacteroidota bacterium]
MNKVSTVILEDSNSFRTILEQLVEESEMLQLIASHKSGEEALKDKNSFNADLYIIDLKLPGISGIDYLKTLQQANQNGEKLILTAYDDDDLVFGALQAGASGYLVKDNVVDQMIPAVQDIMKGGAPMSPKIAKKVIHHFRLDGASPLTTRETEILRLLSKGMTSPKIADELFISKLTVKTHIKNTYKKLSVSSKSEALTVAQSKKFI